MAPWPWQPEVALGKTNLPQHQGLALKPLSAAGVINRAWAILQLHERHPARDFDRRAQDAGVKLWDSMGRRPIPLISMGSKQQIEAAMAGQGRLDPTLRRANPRRRSDRLALAPRGPVAGTVDVVKT